MTFGEIADGASLVDRALVLDPNLAWAWHMSGFANALLGQGGAIVEHAAHAMRLSPQDPQIFAMQSVVALGHFFAGRDDEAFSWAEAACRERSNFAIALGVAAASAALCGRLAEAEKAMARLRQINPHLRLASLVRWLHFQRVEDFDRWSEGLRKAGLPE